MAPLDTFVFHIAKQFVFFYCVNKEEGIQKKDQKTRCFCSIKYRTSTKLSSIKLYTHTHTHTHRSSRRNLVVMLLLHNVNKKIMNTIRKLLIDLLAQCQ